MTNENSFRKTNHSSNLVTVGGLTPFTTIDYPQQLAAVLFLQGCPWRCHYCHNHELINRKLQARIPWPSVLEFLDKRKTLIDAVVFSGGEPTLQAGLPKAMQQVKNMGFKIGLHTAGIYPDRLQAVLPWVDWVGLDIKATKNRYSDITGVRNSGESAWKSARIVVESGLNYEVRTTVHPRLMDPAAMTYLLDELNNLQVENFALQECVSEHSLNPSYRGIEKFPFGEKGMKHIAARFKNFELRTSR
jgi:pyruvate formate lyase activating enzyme